jgi:hypothetical protein
MLGREAEEASFEDLAVGMAEGTITRGRAIKLAGAALVGSALTLVWPAEAEARNRRRRRRRRRRKVIVTPSSVVFQPVNLGDSLVKTVDVKNNGTGPIYIQPDLGDSNFLSDITVPLEVLPGAIETVAITFAPLSIGDKEGLLQISSDLAGNDIVKEVEVLGEGVNL